MAIIKVILEDNETVDSVKRSLNKALISSSTICKAKALPIGTIRVWSGQKYIKHSDGWVALSGEHHGKLKDKFEEKPTHLEFADKHKETQEPSKEQDSPKASKKVGPLSGVDSEALANAHNQSFKDFLESYAQEKYKVPGNRLSKKSQEYLKYKHVEQIMQAEEQGYSVSELVKKEYPQFQGVPKELDNESQKKTNLFKSVDLRKLPKKRQAEVLNTLNDCNLVLAEMGVKFKVPLHFVADTSLRDGSKKDMKATYAGKSGKQREIHLKDASQIETSILHEIGHAIDYAMDEAPASPHSAPRTDTTFSADKNPNNGDKELFDKYKELRNFMLSTRKYSESSEYSNKYDQYINRPTEIFARAFEVYGLGKAQKLISENKLDKKFIEDYLPDIFNDPNSPERQAMLQQQEKVRAIAKKLDLSVAEDKEYEAARQEYNRLRDIYLSSPKLIPEEKQKEYVAKISEIMDFILKHDKIRKAFSTLNL
jgi:hypothetical protein